MKPDKLVATYASLYAPIKGIVKRGDEIDISVFDVPVESFQFIVVIEESSRLFFVQDFLKVFPENKFALIGKWFVEFFDNGVELLVLKS